MAKLRFSPVSPLVFTLFSTLAACGSTTVIGPDGGGDGGPDGGGDAAVETAPPAPKFIEGGGLGGGPLAGRLNVFVIDDETRVRVSGATVRVGASSDPAACTATTDSTGLAILEAPTCALLTGKLSITASATGYAPSTWIGVNSVNVTMAIRAMTAAVIDSAMVTGSITGWSTLPAPAANHNTLGIVGYSAGTRVSDAANNLVQGQRMVHIKVGAEEGDIPFPANICVRNAYANDCAWQLKARTGALALYAVVLDQDTKGTDNNDADDTFTVVGWAVKRGLNLAKDVGTDNVSLTLLADTDMQAFSVTFPSAPSGLDYLGAFPILALGDEGRIAIVAPALDLTNMTTRVPKLAGPFADAHYDFLAKAQDAKDKDQPGSLTWAHDVDATKPVAALSWLSPPTDLKVMDGVYSFTPAAGASVSGGELLTMTGKRAWSITIFDDTTSFTLPGVSPDPLGAGPALFTASGLTVPGFKADDAHFDDLADKLTHIATDQIMFTH